MNDARRSILEPFRRSPGGALVVVGLAIALTGTPAAFSSAIYDNFTLPKQATLLVATAFVLAGLALEGEFLPRDRVLRRLVPAWLAWTTLTLLLSVDPRGSVFGWYQYRQGFATQVTYGVIFLGAVSAVRGGRQRALLLAGFAGLGSVWGYTVIQSLALDPVDWWIDTSERAIGTIGNANELAAYAVIGVAFCGAGASYGRWTSRLVTAGVVGAATFVVLQSQSRSGLMALVLALAMYPVAAVIRRQERTRVFQQVAAMVAGAGAGVVLSLAAGGLVGTAGRVGTGIATSEPGESTRFELWKGTAATITASPVWGHGPDRLAMVFPRHRPGGLGGAFTSYDLVAQSSHNWALDLAANSGVVGLLLVAGFLGRVAWRSASVRDDEPDVTAFAWAALVGYVALTMVNPLSIAAHATFFVLAGMLAGKTELALPPPSRSVVARFERPAFRLAFVAPAGVLLVAAAIALPLADWHAQRGWQAYAGQRFAAAASQYGDAESLMPFERTYQQREANSWLGDAVAGNTAALQRAVGSFQVLDNRFGFVSADAMGMAAALIGLHRPAGEVTPFIDRAVDLNPEGHSTVAYTNELRKASTGGGVLLYSTIDRWVYVEPVPTP